MLMLHSPLATSDELSKLYHLAFGEAIELYIVAAYLTKWDTNLIINNKCKHFRLIVGRDQNFTRKDACLAIINWLPSNRKYQFLIADSIQGFHPKAVFWKNAHGKYFSIIGSSNLTTAAFESNYEANIFTEINSSQFNQAKRWIKKDIEAKCVPVTKDWLNNYKEAKLKGPKRKAKGVEVPGSIEPVMSLMLPSPRGCEKLLRRRRTQLDDHAKARDGLWGLIRHCASGKITSEKFYIDLPTHWGEPGNRLQGKGWERKGKNSNFKEFCSSLIAVKKSAPEDRDDVVAAEIDHLATLGVSTRSALFSEFLCLEYPKYYPVLNDPVSKFLQAAKYSSPKGASDGAKYLDIAIKMRESLRRVPSYPATNLAEVDAILWLKFDKKHKH